MKHTPLHDQHLALNGKMIDFGGWSLPVQYAGVLAEHAAVRGRVGIFDTSHMGEFIIEGEAGVSGLERLVTQRLRDLPVSACRYGTMLNVRGGVIDDLIVYRLEHDKWMLVVNGATTAKDSEHIRRHLTPDAKFIDISAVTGKLDIQGPQSRNILASMIEDIGKLEYYTFNYFDVLGEEVLVSRTGYTGELGFEIYFPWHKMVDLWTALIERKAAPCGLGARDALRLEMGYSLYGHELTEDITPLEAGLNPFIDWDKDFVGKDALKEQRDAGIPRKLVALRSENRRSPREAHTIFSKTGEKIGVVTSGAFSPALQCGIGLGFVARGKAGKDDPVLFGRDESRHPAQVTTRPFFRDGSLKD